MIVQRYDYIRVDEILKKNERLEQKKKEKLENAIDVDSKQQEEVGEKENLPMLNNIFQDATIEQQNQLSESLVQYYDIVHGNTEEPINTSQGYCKKMKNNL